MKRVTTIDGADYLAKSTDKNVRCEGCAGKGNPALCKKFPPCLVFGPRSYRSFIFVEKPKEEVK